MSLLERLTSVVMVFALSGSPAVLTACLALCVQSVATAASPEGSTSAGHAAHLSVPAPSVASGHAHHGAAASNEPTAVASNRASSHASSEARLNAACGDCCADGPRALVASAGVERVNALTLGAGPAASPVASFLLATSVLGNVTAQAAGSTSVAHQGAARSSDLIPPRLGARHAPRSIPIHSSVTAAARRAAHVVPSFGSRQPRYPGT